MPVPADREASASALTPGQAPSSVLVNGNAHSHPRLHRFLDGMRGTLAKQGKVFKQWRNRYFVLDKRVLQCYMDDTMTTVHGDVLIEEGTQIYDVTEDIEGMKNLFYVIGRNSSGVEEVMFVSASSEKDKHDWIESIIDQVHGGFKQIAQSDVWPQSFFPTVDLAITYPNGVTVDNGNILRPSGVSSAPEVHLHGASPNARYCLLLLDVDNVPVNTDNTHDRNYLLWAVINFQGADIATGDEVTSYQSPAPVYDSGLHRYFFLLFELTQVLTPVLLHETVELFLKREAFPLARWSQLLGLEQPAGINGFYAGWEEHCDDSHRKQNFMPPELYRSPGQNNHLANEADQVQLERDKLELYRELGLRDVFGEEDQVVHASTVSFRLTVSYTDSAVIAHDGGIMKPEITEARPLVSFLSPIGSSAGYFLLVMCDPDEPSRGKPTNREYIHWIIANLPGDGDLGAADEILAYESPAPAFATGLHRYVFALYRQQAKFSNVDITAAKAKLRSRSGARTHSSWVKSLASNGKVEGVPVAIDAFLCEWTEHCDALHEAGNFLPAPEYRSPKQGGVPSAGSDAGEDSTADELLAQRLLHKEHEAQQAEQERKLQEAQDLFLKSLEPPTVAVSPLVQLQREEHITNAVDLSPVTVAISTTAAAAPVGRTKETASATTTTAIVQPSVASDEDIMEALASTSLLPSRVLDVPTVMKVEDVMTSETTETRTVNQEAIQDTFTDTRTEEQVVTEETVYSGAINDSDVALLQDEYGRRNQSTQRQLVQEQLQLEAQQGLEQTAVQHAEPSATLRGTATTGATALAPDAAIPAIVTAVQAPAALAPAALAPAPVAPAPMAPAPVAPAPMAPAPVAPAPMAPAALAPAALAPAALTVAPMTVAATQPLAPTTVAVSATIQASVDHTVATVPTPAQATASRTTPAAAQDPFASPSKPVREGLDVPLAVVVSLPSDSAPQSARSTDSPSSLRSTLKDSTKVGTPTGSTVPVKKSVKIADPSNEPPAGPIASMPTAPIADRPSVPTQEPLSVIVPSSPSVAEIPTVASPMGSGTPSPAASVKKKPSLQRNPSVAGMGGNARRSTPSAEPGTPASASSGALSPMQHQDMLSKGMDGLDELLSVGYSSVTIADDDDDPQPARSMQPFAPPGAGSSAPSSASGSTPTSAPGSAKSEPPQLVKKQSLFRPRSQLMTPDAPVPSPVNTMTAPLRRLLSSTPSMYIKPQAAAENIRASLAADSSAAEQCAAFKVETLSVFEGEVMKKKYTSDFIAKDSVLWVAPTTKSLHWAKAAGDSKNSKYIVLDRLYSYDEDGSNRPQGEMKGLLRAVSQNGAHITVLLESGDALELKLAQDGAVPVLKRAADWVKVLKSFLAEGM